jgi:(S)-sulfolactate dehydrogenase
MADIVIPEFMDEDAVNGILGGHDVLYDATLVDRRADLLRAIAEARALIVRNRTRVDIEILDHAKKLQAVGRLGVGLDNIDVAACKARGIAVYPATGANDLSVVEYVITAALMLMRGAFTATAEVVAGEWPRTKLIGREIAGKRMGLLGFGSIGRNTAARAVALGMEVVGFDPHLSPSDPAWSQPWGKVTPLDLDTLLATSDVVSLHVPLTAETRNLIDRTALAKMKRDAILVNAARGGVVDEEAVVDALRARQLGGAALDVFAREPLSKENATIFDRCPNLILTPHIAGVTVESNARVSAMIAEKIRDHLGGK